MTKVYKETKAERRRGAHGGWCKVEYCFILLFFDSSDGFVLCYFQLQPTQRTKIHKITVQLRPNATASAKTRSYTNLSILTMLKRYLLPCKIFH